MAAPRRPVPRRRRRRAAASRTLEDLAPRAPADAAAGLREVGRTLLEPREAGAAPSATCGGRRSSNPADVDALRLLAAAHDALGRASEARDDHLAILRREPDDAPALVALGRLAVRAGDAERGREWFHRYARAARDGADAHLRIALEWLEAGRPADALAAARAGVAELGPDGRLRFAEGLALLELRRFAEAAGARGRAGDGSRVLGPGARRARGRALAGRPSR